MRTTVVTGSDFEMTEDTPSRKAWCSTYLSPKALYTINVTLGIKRFGQRNGPAGTTFALVGERSRQNGQENGQEYHLSMV